MTMDALTVGPGRGVSGTGTAKPLCTPETISNKNISWSVLVVTLAGVPLGAGDRTGVREAEERDGHVWLPKQPERGGTEPGKGLGAWVSHCL